MTESIGPILRASANSVTILRRSKLMAISCRDGSGKWFQSSRSFRTENFSSDISNCTETMEFFSCSMNLKSLSSRVCKFPLSISCSISKSQSSGPLTFLSRSRSRPNKKLYSFLQRQRKKAT